MYNVPRLLAPLQVNRTYHRARIAGDDHLQEARFAGSDARVAEQPRELGRRVSRLDRPEGRVRRLDEARLDHVFIAGRLDGQRGETARSAGRVRRLDHVVAAVLAEHLRYRETVQFALRRDLYVFVKNIHQVSTV